MSVNIIQLGSNQNQPDPNRNNLCGMIEVGNLPQVEALIANGINVNEIDAESGLTPLETAADEGNVAIATLLLTAGASVHAGMFSPLMLAAAKGHTNVVQMLLETGDYAEADQSVYDAFMTGVCAGHLETVRLLVQTGVNLNQVTWDCGSALHYATDEGYLAIATLLLEAGAQVNLVNPLTAKTPLIHAVAQGHLDITRLLLESGADVEAKDKEGKTPLMIAAAKGYAEIARLLIESGADINATDTNGNNALVYTANAEATARIKPMLMAEMSTNEEKAVVEEIQRLNELEQTVVNLKETGQMAIAEMLRQAGASEQGLQEIALITAAADGNLKRVQELLKAGVNVNAKNLEGRTALLEACEGNSLEVIAALLKAGANVNLGECDRFSPLMIAAYRGHKAIVEMLLEAGADIDQTTPYHYTALTYAHEGLHTEIVELLQQNGQKSQ
ncbi:MAG: ankyrin repeat domain-containing protein [Cyanobacteriota bacterium]